MKNQQFSFSQFIGFFSIVLFSGCSILNAPTRTTLPSKPTDTKTPTNSGTSTPTNSGTSTPTNSGTTFSDPDNLRVVFKNPASDSYLNSFTGVARAAAKTTPSDKATTNYNSVGEVLKRLPTDAYMHRVGVNDSSPRSTDEDINVFIQKAYIFSIAKEADGDYHLIIGDLDNGTPTNLMTAEVAGLPLIKGTKGYFLLERTRRQLYEQYPEFFTTNKKKFIPRSVYPQIRIRGSLFFDIHHSAGQIGSGSAKPETVWEIHPTTYLEFVGN